MLEDLLLDSKLITRVRTKEKYSIKLVSCGDYVQMYLYSKPKYREVFEKNDTLNLRYKVNTKSLDHNNLRSKLQCQRLAKANSSSWKSFITLTFREDKTISESKKALEYFVKNIKKKKNDFKYICIIEMQKRGVPHFHLLTNLECGSFFLPKREKLKLYNPTTKTNKVLEYYDIKYWNRESLGFSMAEPMENDIKKVVGYISKYMTKYETDFFGFKKYTCSQNLIKPTEDFISLRNKKHRDYLKKILSDKVAIYSNDYYDIFNDKVTFYEFKK